MRRVLNNPLMACGRCAKRVRAFCTARWARLRVHGAGSAEEFRGEAEALPVAGWRLASTRDQLASLEKLLARFPAART